MDNIVKYYGDWTVPTSWGEITLGQYSAIRKFMSEKGIAKFDVRAVLHILTNHTEDEVDALPIDFAESILQHLTFITTDPEVAEPTNKIVIDGTTYQINFQEKMKLGEFVASDMAMKANQFDYPTILAILCRKEGEPYDAKFSNEVFDERRSMFEKQPMVKCMPLIAFFLICWIISDKTFLKSSKEALVEEINHTAQRLKTSKNLGLGKKLCLNLQMKKLEKSLRSNKLI